MSINWDDPAMAVTESDFIDWTAVGQSVEGKLVGVTQGTDFNGAPCPQLEIETESGTKTVTCGQADIKAKVIALRPAAGQRIRIDFSAVKPTASGFKKKIFDVQYPVAAPAATPAPAAAPAAAVASDEPPF